MENLNTTNSKARGSKKSLIYLLSDFSLNLETSSQNWEVTTNIRLADLFIQRIANEYTFKYRTKNIYKNLCVQESNLEITLNYVYKILNTENLFDSQTSQTKKIASIPATEKYWSPSHLELIKLNTFFLSSNDICSFTQSLFQLKSISQFETIHLFIHEKGNQKAQHVHITSSDASKSSQMVQEFTSLFQAIKKSKNRSFGQSTLKSSNFKIIGTCLAHELSLTNHNVIFLISKNDFLPQNQIDIDFFTDFITILSPFLNLLLSKELSDKKTEIYKGLFGTISSYLENNPKNDSSKNFFLQDIERTIELIQKSTFNLVDVNHQERIILLGELLNTLKHELSNPLFGLQLTTELLLLDELSEDQNIFIHEISMAIKRSQNIIGSFSDIYSESSKIEVVDLIHLIREVFTLTKSESRSIPKTITINSKLIRNQDVKLQINTNQTWLAQIFFNLIINSSQAISSQGTQDPFININLDKNNQGIEITIKDNGPGLKKCLNENIFNPFYTTKTKGTGLGLSITKSLVQKLNGEIENIPSDKGAKFLIRLPNEIADN